MLITACHVGLADRLVFRVAGIWARQYRLPTLPTLQDKHFADCWVVAWGPGFQADLALEWESFRAARTALAGTASVPRARELSSLHALALPQLQAELSSYLHRGSFTVRHARTPPIAEMLFIIRSKAMFACSDFVALRHPMINANTIGFGVLHLISASYVWWGTAPELAEARLPGTGGIHSGAHARHTGLPAILQCACPVVPSAPLWDAHEAASCCLCWWAPTGCCLWPCHGHIRPGA